MPNRYKLSTSSDTQTNQQTVMETIQPERSLVEWKDFVHNTQTPIAEVYRNLMDATSQIEEGRRTAWALNLISRMCVAANGQANPATLPDDAEILRNAFQEVTSDLSYQMQKKALYIIRIALQSHPLCSRTLFPRRLGTAPDPVRRSYRVVQEDALPKGIKFQWLKELFVDIIRHPATSGWKTSASANQNLSMLYKFIRSTKLLDARNREEFDAAVLKMNAQDVKEMCELFTDSLCSSAHSAKAYLTVMNMFFVRFYGVIKDPVKTVARKRRIVTLQQLDVELSSKGSTLGSKLKRAPYLTSEEVDRLCTVAEPSPKCSLIIGLLSTTEQDVVSKPRSWLRNAPPRFTEY